MFIYKIVTGEYEYQSNYLLSHEQEYTKEEFINIIKGAVNYLKNRNLDDSVNKNLWV